MPITDNLISWWEFESGVELVDSVVASANDLTNTNVVTFAAGKVGDAAHFVRASSQRLTRADNASLSTGDIDFTLGGWFRNTSKPAAMYLAAKGDFSGANLEWALQYDDGGDRFRFFILEAITIVTDTQIGSPANGTWYFIVAGHDSVNNLIFLSINDGAVDTAAHVLGTVDSTAAFTLGARSDAALHYDGDIDQAFFFKRVLSAADITYLYNSGNGRSYAELTASFIPDPRLHGLNAGIMKLNGGLI